MRRPGAEGMDCHRPRGLSRFPKIGWSRVLEWRDFFFFAALAATTPLLAASCRFLRLSVGSSAACPAGRRCCGRAVAAFARGAFAAFARGASAAFLRRRCFASALRWWVLPFRPCPCPCPCSGAHRQRHNSQSREGVSCAAVLPGKTGPPVPVLHPGRRGGYNTQTNS